MQQLSTSPNNGCGRLVWFKFYVLSSTCFKGHLVLECGFCLGRCVPCLLICSGLW